MRSALIVAAGVAPTAELIRSTQCDFVFAVDGGVGPLRAAEVPPTHLIGDMDSAAADDRAWAESHGAVVLDFPPAKDQTDLELALVAAEEAGAEQLIVLGVAGGREDHSLGNWATLCSPRVASVEVRSADSIAHVVRTALTMAGEAGDMISIIPWGGTAEVSTTGLRWPLTRAVLSPFEALGISNEFVGESAGVAVHEGVAIVVRPTG